MQYVAFTTKGLEKITQSELQKLLGLKIIQTGDKRIIFETVSDFNSLSSLRTVDDIGLLIGQVENVTKVSQILDFIKTIDLDEVKKELRIFREIEQKFSITISSARSSLNTKELLPALAFVVKEKYGLSFVELEHNNLDIKVFIDHTDVILSVRLTEKSLHNRIYKKLSRPGSLKPTVAAAMVQLATEYKKHNKIVDNFCGSGTILCESLVAENFVYGGDIDPESVNMAKSNLDNLSHNYGRVTTLDAKKSGWPDKFFDIAISNLPWDKQIKIESITELYEGILREYARILKPEGVLCALVGKPELFVKYAKKYFPLKTIKEIKIGLLGQNPTIVLLK